MRKATALLFLFLVLLPFQGCGGKMGFLSLKETGLQSENGEGYGGKPTPYDFSDANRTCADIGANGKPLPNSQIFLFSNNTARLVRENCADIVPRTLSIADYSFAANGNLIYQNQTFLRNSSQSPFDVVAATCPAGKTMLANATRTSFVQEPLDLQSAVWEHGGLAVTLEGSLASLPLYRVERNDPTALESWHRMAQSPILTAGESYVYSFYVRPDASEKAMFTSYFPNTQDFRIEFDLVGGGATVQSAVGVAQVSTKARAFAGGLFISIYFQSLASTSANIGIASSGAFLGSAISTTALQLERISNFCSP